MTDQHNQHWFALKIVTTLLVMYWVAMFTGTHIPQPPPVMDPRGNDKIVHFGASGGLAFLLCLNYALRWPMTWRSYLQILGVVAAYGAIDEWTQIIVGRNCELLDWTADVSGALCSVGLWAFATLVYRKLRSPRGVAGNQ